MKKTILLIFLSITQVFSQKNNYPQGYFMFPINPGQQNFLAGGVGDLRPNHFHTGIDIKTQYREGLPVHAAAEGYISKIMVMPSGYGNVIFITHPNGYKTTYAHLKEFTEPLKSFIIQERLKKQTFQIELNPDSSQFKVTRGQIIAFSGNTGSSAGPHLHFEIRDFRNNILNPLYFGFKEIIDNTPPVFQKIIFKPFTIQSRIEEDFSRKILDVQKAGQNSYILPKTIVAEGEIGMEMLAFDKLDGVQNTNGLTCIEVKVNDEEVFYYHFEMLPYEFQHDINVHNDFALVQQTSQYFQKLYVANGNDRMPLYKQTPQKGRLKIEEGKTYQIQINIFDQNQNKAALNFTIVGQKSINQTTIIPNKLKTQIKTSVEENILHIRAMNFPTANPTCQLFVNQDSTNINPDYIKNNEAHFLVDLRKKLVSRIKIHQQEVPVYFQKLLFPNQENQFEVGNSNILFPGRALYDTLALYISESENSFDIGENITPLRENIEIIYLPTAQPIYPDKTFVYLLKNGQPHWIGGAWGNGRIKFTTSNFGKFIVLTDTIPPIAHLVRKDKYAFSYRISDNLSGIKSFKAKVNDEFVLMDYDPKRALIWSMKKDSLQQFTGNLTLQLTDNAGNTNIFNENVDVPTLILKKKNKIIVKKTHKKR